MKIIHHRYLNVARRKKKKKPSPLSPFNNNKFSKNASNLSKESATSLCVCVFVSQKKKKKKKVVVPHYLKECVVCSITCLTLP